MPDICPECHSTITPNYRGACVTCLRREIDRLRRPSVIPMPDLYEIPDLEWYTTNFDGHTAWRGHSGTFSVLLVFQGGYWRIDAHSIGGGCMYGYWKGVDAAKAASNANWKSRMASALRPVKLTMRIDNMNQPVTPFIINGAPDAAGGVG